MPWVIGEKSMIIGIGIVYGVGTNAKFFTKFFNFLEYNRVWGNGINRLWRK